MSRDQREIKFRAWDNVDKRMYEVFSFCKDFVKVVADWANEPLKLSRERFVLMQYTGLKDKNNIDIYEGDKTVDGVIEFNVDTCCYIIRRRNGTFIRLDIRKNNIEILGNIYQNQNPELISK